MGRSLLGVVVEMGLMAIPAGYSWGDGNFLTLSCNNGYTGSFGWNLVKKQECIKE